MGQIPSISYEPFVVCLESIRVSERLAAIPLTKATIGDIDTPLFKMFYNARCDESTRHWYCSPSAEDFPMEPPSPEIVYKKYIEEPSIYLQKHLGTKESPFAPVPIVLLKLHEPWVSNRQVPTLHDLCLGTGCEVIGYFGCRSFNGDGSCDDHATLGLFLTRAFHNEAKSVAILEIACRCFVHYSHRAVVQWPREIRFSTSDSNLPCLRMMQKLLASMGPSFMEAWSSSIDIECDESDSRVHVAMRGGGIRSLAETLAAHVDPLTFVVRTKSVEPTPSTVVFPALDAAVIAAKAKWIEVNRTAHHEHRASQKAGHHNADTLSIATYDGDVNGLSSAVSSEPTTPIPTSRRSSFLEDRFLTRAKVNPHTEVMEHYSPLPSNQPSPVPQSFQPQPQAAAFHHLPGAGTPAPIRMHYNDPYHHRTIEVYSQPSSPLCSATRAHRHIAPIVGAPLQHIVPQQSNLYKPSSEVAPVEKPALLYLPKRTTISFWKKGRWLHAQWRNEERFIQIARVQHAVDNGLLCVEALGPEDSLDVAIFDEWNRPARLHLEHRNFYVPLDSVKQFQQGDNIATQGGAPLGTVVLGRPTSLIH